nr:hypothetical protein [Tanacetum cinerariifolium]
MGDTNPIRTLGDYFILSHEGYRNTIELPEGNNVVPLRSDIIRKRILSNRQNAVIDCRKAKIAVGEGITRKDFLDCHLLGKWEIAKDVEVNPFKGILVFRRIVEFLGAIPINLTRNMWESKDLKKSPINLDKPLKNREEAWHVKIRLIDPDGEEFTKTLQSVPTSRKLSAGGSKGNRRFRSFL